MTTVAERLHHIAASLKQVGYPATSAELGKQADIVKGLCDALDSTISAYAIEWMDKRTIGLCEPESGSAEPEDLQTARKALARARGEQS